MDIIRAVAAHKLMSRRSKRRGIRLGNDMDFRRAFQESLSSFHDLLVNKRLMASLKVSKQDQATWTQRGSAHAYILWYKAWLLRALPLDYDIFRIIVST